MKVIASVLMALAVAVTATRGAFAAVVPAGWTRGARAAADTKLQLTLAVNLEGTVELESELYAVSDPASARYGKHLSKADVSALVRPSSGSLSAAKEWMASHGIAAAPVNGGEYITGTVTVAQAEAMLGTEYYTWTAGDAVVTRAADFSLPTELEGHVDFVSPTTGFPRASAPDLTVAYRGRGLRGLSSSSSSSSGGPAGEITPDVIARVYGTADATTEGNLQGNHLAVAQFLGQFYSPTDLSTFFKAFAPAAEGRTPTVYGPNDPNSPGVEASLDIQYAMGVANHVPTYFFSTPGQQPGSPENEPFLTWLQKVAAFPDDQLPGVISVSYGDNENTVVYEYATRVNTEFQKLGARGVTILFSSGDGGVAGSQSTPCTDFLPTFPAASPYVTAVGGTKLVGTDSEVAAGLSSGGFSNYWPRPSYQDAAVKAYLSNSDVTLPPAGRFNHTGAGFPDVAAFAENFQVVYEGSVTPVAGTSCASPTFAGVMALVNGARMVQGKPAMGWLNPWLYTHGSVFTDITSGNNPGCDTAGFQAAAGWDPITGWGSPNYNKLVKATVFEE